ncbi:MAG: ABC transporter permease, partial [Acidimicrobiia bacterium]|nr:ABC transporter permease [Acidimicrobiia bacterium]
MNQSALIDILLPGRPDDGGISLPQMRAIASATGQRTGATLIPHRRGGRPTATRRLECRLNERSDGAVAPNWGFIWMVAWPDFRARLRRFLVIGAGMALVLAITLLLSAFSEGFNLRSERLLGVFDGDQYLVTEGAAGPMTSTSPFPAVVLDEVATAPGVERAAPLFLAPNAVLIDGRPASVVVVATPDDVAWPGVVEGRTIAGPGEAVIDEELFELSLGDDFVLAGASMTVVGVTRNATWDIATAGLFIDDQQARDLFAGGLDVVTAVIVDGDLAQVP